MHHAHHILTFGDLFRGTIIAGGVFVIVGILIVIFGYHR